VRQIFKQLVHLLTCTLFNAMLMTKEYCSYGKAFDVKMRIASVEEYLKRNELKDWMGDAYKEIEPLRELISVLLVHKDLIANKDARNEICPKLNLVQLKQVLSNYTIESNEDPISIYLIKSIVQSPDYRLSDPLLMDTQVMYPINLQQLHPISTDELKNIPFPTDLQAEFTEQLEGKSSSISVPVVVPVPKPIPEPQTNHNQNGTSQVNHQRKSSLSSGTQKEIPQGTEQKKGGFFSIFGKK